MFNTVNELSKLNLGEKMHIMNLIALCTLCNLQIILYFFTFRDVGC